MSNNNITPFLFEGEITVRVIERDGTPWFVATDVCAVLDISKHRDAAARLGDDERGSVIVDTLGGPQEMTVINESGLYALIFKSRKPQAARFRKWVTSEVLPSIRQTGRYEAPSSDVKAAPEQRPWMERPMEAQAIALRTATLYGKFGSHASAWWYMMEVEGMPQPPQHLQPAWRQSELMPAQGKPAGQGASVVIMATLNGEMH